MTTPFMYRFARPVTEEPLRVPGRYEPALGLRVVDTDEGARPLVATDVDLTLTLTKTDRQVEGDDESPPRPSPSPRGRPSADHRLLLATMTKTAAGETDFDEPATSVALLALLTKTLDRRESDDED